MPAAQATDTPESPVTAQSPLGYVHGLLAAPADGPQALPALLSGLARAFAAPAAGLAALADGAPVLNQPPTDGPTPVRRPWQNDPTLLARARTAMSAMPWRAPDGGHYLLAAAWPPGLPGWLLWVEDAGRDDWTADEGGALVLAALVLARFLPAAEQRPGWAAQLERLARRQQLEAAARVTRRLAHDFGNVLTGILGFSDLSLSEVADDGKPLHKFLTELHHSAHNGARYIERLRQFALHSANPRAAADLGPALAREGARLRQLGDDAPPLQTAIPADLPALAIDGDNLARVVEVLVENAREASRPGGEPIRVAARVVTLGEGDCLDFYGDPRPGPHVEVTVTDGGAGLSADAEGRLFGELFFTSKSRRRGLGLAAAYGILRCHRGGLCLANRPGGGARARLVVPVAAEDLRPAPAADGAAAASGGESILVVDDDPLVLQYLCATLVQAGYRVQAASGSREALQLYSAAPQAYRLVVSDVLMPGVNGFDLARQLHDRNAGVRVLFISGQLPLAGPAADAGGCAFDLLAKPFRPEALLRAVRAALDRPPSRTAPVRTGPAGGSGVLSSSQ
jgi:signal transduction histidine kinase/ActR/RegA family two-component response regulator